MTDGNSGKGASYRRQATAWLFGDRLGLALFLGTLASFFAWWRIGFFITDSTTVANALVNVGNGRLAVVESPYALTFGSQPGLHRVGDQLYGRNYGHVLLALPVLWLLEGASAVTDPVLLLAGAWSLLLVVLARQVAVLAERRRVATVGSALALVLFVGNVVTATSLSGSDQPWAAFATTDTGAPLELIALQVTTMVAAAVLATTTYRLLALFHGRRVGIAAGIAVVLATPVGFWASIPKRHILTATAVVVVLYCFAVSREQRGTRGRLARAGAYVTLGLLTTIHPFEALFLFLVLVPLDLLTAPTNGSRTLAVVGVAFFLSLVPFFVLNTLFSGNPLRPPRMLPGVGVNVDLQPALEPEPPGEGESGAGGSGTDDGGSGGGDQTQNEGETSDGGGVIPAIPVEALVGPVSRGVGYGNRVVGFATGAVVDGVDALSDSKRLYHTFVRSGRIPGVSYAVNDFETVELALLEVFPLAAALLWLPVAGFERLREGIDRSAFGRPARQTDLLAAVFAVVFVTVYMPRLPLHSMVTLRYILPVMPLVLYGVARLQVVRRPIEAVPRWLAGAYISTVLGGGVALGLLFALVDPAVGEAVQFHALVGLTAATLAALAVLTRARHGSDRVVAVALALPAGATTIFLTLSSLTYFDYGRHALGLVRVFAGTVPF